jgi:hypothetical protein
MDDLKPLAGRRTLASEVAVRSQMTLQRKPEDQQGGFETSSELRHDEPAKSPPPAPPMEKSMWVGVGLLPVVVVVLIVGAVIYFLVTSL